MTLSTTVDSTYTNRSAGDAQHQQDHDVIHAAINALNDAYAAAQAQGFAGSKQAWLDQIQKLSGIEAGADVTDATNVAAAGAVMESDTTTAAMSFVIDEDTMVSNLATKVPTQQSVKAYVDAQVGSVGGSSHSLLTGFAYSGNGSSSGVMRRFMYLSSGATGSTTGAIVMTRPGSILGISVAGDTARTAGTATFEVYKNGVGTGLTVTIDGTNTQYHYAAQASGTDTFIAGDRLNVQFTLASLSPTIGFEVAIGVELS